LEPGPTAASAVRGPNRDPGPFRRHAKVVGVRAIRRERAWPTTRGGGFGN
jgi:hypothetical protein